MRDIGLRWKENYERRYKTNDKHTDPSCQCWNQARWRETRGTGREINIKPLLERGLFIQYRKNLIISPNALRQKKRPALAAQITLFYIYDKNCKIQN